MLLGQTLAGMRVWDVKRGLAAVSSQNPGATSVGAVHARREMAVNALYASLFVKGSQWRDLLLADVPASHRVGPDYLNVLRILDIPAAIAMASQRGVVAIKNEDKSVAEYAQKVSAALTQK